MKHEIPMLNAHIHAFNYRQRKAELADRASKLDLEMEAVDMQPEFRTGSERFSLDELGLEELPGNVFLGTNGQYPAVELMNQRSISALQEFKYAK